MRPFIIAASLAALYGCATVETTFQSDGMKVASFDLQCPPEQIEMTVLTRNDGLGCLGSKVGVRGCGRQTTYECDNARTWHRSAEVSAVDPTAAAAAPSATDAPSAPSAPSAAPASGW